MMTHIAEDPQRRHPEHRAYIIVRGTPVHLLYSGMMAERQ